MSLNGLESAEVLEAYQAAIAEAGGWLLLKYASRDSVELLGRGKGGVSEARSALVKYEELSPVYGVIVYRRRKVLIKYVPEGTSRVVLARTTVHYQDVLEKYSPYEALLEISSAEGLTDTTLAASFPLHTATPSGSSSRLQLDEITEDGEDPGPQKASLVPRPPTSSSSASQRYRMERRIEQRAQSARSPTQSARPTSPLASNVPSPMKTSVSQFLVRSDSGKPSVTSIGSDSVASMAEYAPSEASIKDNQSVSTVETSRPSFTGAELSQPDPSGASVVSSFEETRSISTSTGNALEFQQTSDLKPLDDERMSSATRPSFSEQSNYENDLFDFLKPKVKLGPRPVTAGERARRPLTAGVSSMPATYRHSMRKQEQSQRNRTERGLAPSPLINKAFPAPPPIPETPDYNNRPVSKGSIKSAPSHKSTAMTPDKLRLMKAVELRKRQMRKSNPNVDNLLPPPDEDVPTVPSIPEQHPTEDEAPDTAKDTEPIDAPEVPKDPQKELASAGYKADSGIELEYPPTDQQIDLEPATAAPVEEEPVVAAPVEEEEPAVDPIIEDEPPVTAPVEEEEEPSTPVVQKPPSKLSELSTSPESPKYAIPGSFLESASTDSESEHNVDSIAQVVDDEGSSHEPIDDSVPQRDVDEAAPATLAEDDVVRTPTTAAPDVPTLLVTSSSAQKKQDRTPSFVSDVDGNSGEESTSSTTGLARDWETSPKRRNSEWVRKRQGVVEPLHVESESEDDSEDDLMEELQSAQLQEAKPIVVSRSSPVQPFFPPIRRPSGNSAREIGAVSASSPLAADSTVSAASLAFETKNGAPATYQPRARTADGNEPPLPTKRNVSSEISKRIQALAGTSNRDNSPTTNAAMRPTTPDSLTMLSSARNPVHTRNRSFNAFTKYSKASAIQNQMIGDAPQQSPPNGPVWSIQHDPNTNRESVSVTARIVRPPLSERMESYDSTDADSPQSQFSSGHKRGAASQGNITALQQIDTKLDSPGSKADLTPVNSISPTLSRASKEGARLPYSTNSLKSTSSPTRDELPSLTRPPTSSTLRTLMNDENAAPKEGSRTSRFFKRMSHIGGKRKSGNQQPGDGMSTATASTAALNNAPTRDRVEIQSIMLPAITIGDLNIQFPDSLLWKRRIVTIDDAGYVRFLPPEHQKASPRHFRLSDFRMPYVPDLDRQELQNSVMLDFIDGTTLQIACEDSVTHLQVTHLFKTYWRAWARY